MSLFDPFAPRPGAAAQPVDPFAPRVPGQAPPLGDGRIACRLSVHIFGDPANHDSPGGRRRDIQNFNIVDDIRSLYDPFSFSIPNPGGEFNYLLGYRWRPIDIYEEDPFVRGGAPTVIMAGVIVDVSQSSGEDGTVLHVSGFDRGWWLTCNAPFFKNLRQFGDLQALASYMIKTSYNWGLRATVPLNYGIDMRLGRNLTEVQRLQGQIRQQITLNLGRTDIVNALYGQLKSITPRIQTEPGETIGDVLIRYARLSKYLINVSPLGDLQFFRPDYTQDVSYTFNWHFPRKPGTDEVDTRALWNVPLSSEYALQGDPIYTSVECVGSVLFGITLGSPADDPNEGRFSRSKSGRPEGVTINPLPYRYLAFSDGERYSGSMAAQRALWKYQQGEFEAETLTYTVQGHSLAGVPYVAGTMAQVNDSRNGLFKKMYVSRVQRVQNESTTAILTLKPPGKLAA